MFLDLKNYHDLHDKFGPVDMTSTGGRSHQTRKRPRSLEGQKVAGRHLHTAQGEPIRREGRSRGDGRRRACVPRGGSRTGVFESLMGRRTSFKVKANQKAPEGGRDVGDRTAIKRQGNFV